jgi:NAD+ diphosphatase
MNKPYQKPAQDEPVWWFVISAGDILVTEDKQIPHGYLSELPMPDLREYKTVFIGELRERHCYLVIADFADTNFTAVGDFISVRELITEGDDELFAMAARAKQVADFLATHRFCGRCGARMQAVDWELAMHCHSCQHRCYPRISPCIIVAIRRDNQILLARGKRHPEGLYSVLAGFAEAGEALEQTLAREVMEEAGVHIKNPRYVSSQSWPFPNSLMVGFIADWAGGDVRIDPFELEEGGWFDINKLPKIPGQGTIANKLIMRVKAEIDQERKTES